MTNCYSKEYLDAYDVLEEHWDDSKEPQAKLLRDRRARELRKQGWTVQIETKDYSDLSRCVLYSVFAEKKKVLHEKSKQ